MVINMTNEYVYVNKNGKLVKSNTPPTPQTAGRHYVPGCNKGVKGVHPRQDPKDKIARYSIVSGGKVKTSAKKDEHGWLKKLVPGGILKWVRKT